jgi:hypothetical protein
MDLAGSILSSLNNLTSLARTRPGKAFLINFPPGWVVSTCP